MSEIPSETSPVIVTNEEKPTLESPTKKASSSAPKWELAARERMKAAIKKFNKPLTDLVARDANEGDTRLLVTDMLCDGSKVLCSDNVLSAIRKELKRTTGQSVNEADVRRLLKDTVLKPECLNSK